MKKTLRIAAAAALAAALLLGAAVSAADPSATIYLMSVNDIVVDVMEMTSGNLPMVVDGVLYVPYTMLNSRVTGINLGVNAQYSTTKRTVLVSSGQRGIIFDTQSNTACDIGSNPVNTQAVVRNAMVYLPIAWLCEYFGNISYSLNRTRYGILVRVTNSAVILDDVAFIDAANSLLADNLRRYQESIRASAAPSSAPPAVQTPAPAHSQPAVSAPPVTPSPPPVEDGPDFCLAFRWGKWIQRVARQMEDMGERALFLFTGDEIAANAPLIRRLAASGHWFGLVLTGETAEECLAQAEEGRLLLAAAARCPVLIAAAPELDGPGRAALAEAGWALWEPDALGVDYASAAALVRALDRDVLSRVEVACDDGGLVIVLGLENAIESSRCTLERATAPLLAPLSE